MIRRLDPDKDIDLFKEAYLWGRQRKWFREIENQFGASTFEEFISDAERDVQVDVGVFDNQLIGLITLELKEKGIYEAHIRVSRDADLNLIALGALSIREQLFRELGAKEIFGQIPNFNKGAIQLAEMCGLYRDGITVIQGQVRNRLIEWVRVSYGEEETEARDNAAEFVQQHEHLRVHNCA